MTKKTKQNLTKAALMQFSGTEQWYRHSIAKKVLYTDGAKFVADEGEAYWLLDDIVFAQYEQAVAAELFQRWVLKVNADHTAILTCEDGNCNEVFTKRTKFTDFPLNEIAFYFNNNVIMLPSEW